MTTILARAAIFLLSMWKTSKKRENPAGSNFSTSPSHIPQSYLLYVITRSFLHVSIDLHNLARIGSVFPSRLNCQNPIYGAIGFPTANIVFPHFIVFHMPSCFTSCFTSRGQFMKYLRAGGIHVSARGRSSLRSTQREMRGAARCVTAALSVEIEIGKNGCAISVNGAGILSERNY